MASVRTTRETVRKAFEALNDRNREGFRELHAADAVVDTSGEQFRGIDAIEEEEFGLFESFSDLTYAIEELVGEGDLVAARWTATGTHDGELGGIEPTGRTVEFPVFGMFRIDEGRIAYIWILPDRLAMLEQLDAIDRPGV